MKKPGISLIQGGKAKDHRGQIRFVNDFVMDQVKRFYLIRNADTELIRGWRAHRIEQRWFYVLSGSFSVAIVKIDDWEQPSRNLPVQRRTLAADQQELMHVPPGYGTAFRALSPDSELLVFADYGIDHAPMDDYTYTPDYFWMEYKPPQQCNIQPQFSSKDHNKTTMLCIETSGLNHRFPNGQVAVDQLSMQVPQGSIYGFLGPNGAGKTTTLRLLLGLLRRQEGEVRFFGRSMSGNRVKTLTGIGSMIETPSVYGHLSARDNLKIWTDYFHCPVNRIDEVLEIVGLADTAKKKAHAFSLGMKQRLGIAIALLHKPGVLILDEPTNGLDPTGIIEIRDLLKRINKEEQITILVSSHILAEVEKLVSHVGIINHGKLLFQGTFSDLLSKEKQGVLLETGNNALAIQLLREKSILAELSGDELLLPVLDQRSRAEIVEFLVSAKVPVYRLEQRGKNLETIFMDMIK